MRRQAKKMKCNTVTRGPVRFVNGRVEFKVVYCRHPMREHDKNGCKLCGCKGFTKDRPELPVEKPKPTKEKVKPIKPTDAPANLPVFHGVNVQLARKASVPMFINGDTGEIEHCESKEK